MTALVVLGAVSTCKPLPDMLRALLTTTGGGCDVMHVEDAAADRLRSDALDGVKLQALVDPAARLAPARVWAPLADQGLVDALEHGKQKPLAVVVYPHREYDPIESFPRLRMACFVAGVPLVDGRNNKLVRRSPNDPMRDVKARYEGTPLQRAIAASLPTKANA